MSQRTDYHPAPPPVAYAYAGPERRASTALSLLGRQFDQACTRAVDSLQIAAALESGGVTDRVARDEYGFPDVFSLAEALYRRVPRRLAGAEAAYARGERWQTLRELSHGPLFALPAAAYLALSHALGAQGLTVGLVLSTAVGWAWGLGVSWLAYRLIGRGLRQEAARWLLRLSLMGVLGVELVAAPLTQWLGLEPSTLALATEQMAYQMAASVLIIYRLEGWLWLAVMPCLAANGWYLLSGSPEAGLPVALSGSAASLTLVLAAAAYALWKTPRTGAFTPTLTRQDFLEAAPLVLYGAFSAALVLLGNTRYMFSSLDLSLSLTPLILCMGVLEWQSRRFRERSALLLRETRRVREFRAGERRVLLETLGVSLLALTLLSALFTLWLGETSGASAQGAMMLAAQVALAAAFYANYILLARGHLRWVLGSFGAGVPLYALGTLALDPALAYLITTALLALVVTAALWSTLGEVAQYR